MAKVTMTIAMDTENAGDLSILQVVKKIASSVNIDIQPAEGSAPVAEQPKAAAKTKQAAKPTGPKAVPDEPKTEAPPSKKPEDMDFDELAQFVPLQRKVTKELAFLLAKQNKIKHGGVDVIGKALETVGAGKFKDVKDHKVFVEALIKEDSADVGI